MKVILTEEQIEKLKLIRDFFTSNPLMTDEKLISFCKINSIPVYIQDYSSDDRPMFCVCFVGTPIGLYSFVFMTTAKLFITLHRLEEYKVEKSFEDKEEVIRYIKVKKD